METEHTPNEFPFSTAIGSELLAVPLSYATSSDGRQVVFTTMSVPSQGQGQGQSHSTGALPLMSDPAGFLDALKHDTLVTVDAFEGFTAPAAESVPAASRTTGDYQSGHEMASGSELVHAVTELQLQQYVQHEHHQHQHERDSHHGRDSHHHHQQQQQRRPSDGDGEGEEETEHDHALCLVEVVSRSGAVACFVCDSPVSGGAVEIFGEANVLSASKTPVCVKLECLLGCALHTEGVHSDVICTSCLHALELVDRVDWKRQELERRCRELSGRIRRRFGRTVRHRQLNYDGWQPETETETETETGTGMAAGAETPQTRRLREAEAGPGPCGAGVEPVTDRGVTGEGAPPDHTDVHSASGSPAGSPGQDAGCCDDPDDPDEPPRPEVDQPSRQRRRRARPAATDRQPATPRRQHVKVTVTDPRVPGRTRTKYIYSERRFTCHVCGKTFTWQGHLNKHIQTHTGEKPLKCDVCGQTFRWHSHLTNHLRRHNDERPFGCSVCGKRFVSGTVLRAHQRTHSDEKPYMCGTCGRQFRDRSNLTKHAWVHTDERPHRCEPCDRGFLTTSALKVHNRTAHGGVPPPQQTVKQGT